MLRMIALGGLVAALGCSAAPSVRIAAPNDGDTLSGSFLVRLTATGVRVVPATGTAVAGEGHHHVYIDADPGNDPGAILTGPGIVHLGKGVDTLRVDSLVPGSHRIIAVFAAGDHVPMAGVRRDTAQFVVR